MTNDIATRPTLSPGTDSLARGQLLLAQSFAEENPGGKLLEGLINLIGMGFVALGDELQKIDLSQGVPDTSMSRPEIARQTLRKLADSQSDWVLGKDPATGRDAVVDSWTKLPVAAVNDNGIVEIAPTMRNYVTRKQIHEAADRLAQKVVAQRKDAGQPPVDRYRLQGQIIDYARGRLDPQASGATVGKLMRALEQSPATMSDLVRRAGGASTTAPANVAQPSMTKAQADRIASQIITERLDALKGNPDVANLRSDLTSTWPYEGRVDPSKLDTQVRNRLSAAIRGSLKDYDLSPQDYVAAIRTQSAKVTPQRVMAEYREAAFDQMPGATQGGLGIYKALRQEILDDLTARLKPEQKAMVAAQLDDFVSRRRPESSNSLASMVDLLKAIRTSPGLTSGWVNNAIGGPIGMNQITPQNPDPAGQPGKIPPPNVPLPPVGQNPPSNPVPPANLPPQVPPANLPPQVPPGASTPKSPDPVVPPQPTVPDPVSQTPDTPSQPATEGTGGDGKKPEGDEKDPKKKIPGWVYGALGGAVGLAGVQQIIQWGKPGTDTVSAKAIVPSDRNVEKYHRDSPLEALAGRMFPSGGVRNLVTVPAPNDGDNVMIPNPTLKIGDYVKKGTVLFTMRDSALAGRITDAEAKVENARTKIVDSVAAARNDLFDLRSRLTAAQAQVTNLKQSVVSGTATLDLARSDLRRYEGLANEGAVPPALVDQKRVTVNNAESALAATRTSLAAAEDSVRQLSQRIALTEAAVGKTPDQLVGTNDLPPVIQAAVQGYRDALATLSGLQSEKSGQAVTAPVAGILVGFPQTPYNRVDFLGVNPSPGDQFFGLQRADVASPEGTPSTLTPTILATKIQEDVNGNVTELPAALYYNGLDPENLEALRKRVGQRVAFVAPDGREGTGQINMALVQGQSLGGSLWVTDLKDLNGKPMDVPDNLALWRLFVRENPITNIHVNNVGQVKTERPYGAEQTRYKFPVGKENVTVTIPVHADDGDKPGKKLGDIEVRYTTSTNAKTIQVENPTAVFKPVGNASGTAINVSVGYDDGGGKIQAGLDATGVADSRALLRMSAVFTSENRSVTVSTGLASQQLAANSVAINLEFGVIPSGVFPQPKPLPITSPSGAMVEYPKFPLSQVVNLPEVILISDPNLINSR